MEVDDGGARWPENSGEKIPEEILVVEAVAEAA